MNINTIVLHHLLGGRESERERKKMGENSITFTGLFKSVSNFIHISINKHEANC